MLFALLVEFGPNPPSEELLEAHRNWLFAQFSQGHFILSGGLDAVDDHPPSALALFEADSLEAATRLLDDEPLYASGSISQRVVPFVPRVRVVDMDSRFAEDVRAIPVDVG
jgi:uncharacterized protein YciI